MRLANQSRIAFLSLKMRARSAPSFRDRAAFHSRRKRSGAVWPWDRSSFFVAWLLPLVMVRLCPSALVLQPFAMSRLLGAVAADRHAAPAPRAPCGVVGK